MREKTKEYRKELAEMFLHVLEEKELDWRKEWKGAAVVPVNARTGARYKGINRFRLLMTSMARGYDDPRWATFHQIQDMGLRLSNAKGQGVPVEYWYPYDQKEKRALTWEEYDRVKVKPEEEGRYCLFARYSTVFNASLIPGLPSLPEPEQGEIAMDALVNTLSEAMEVEIVHDGGDRAFYRVKEDKIHLPEPGYFFSDYAYNSTALHELAHATGASHRLNRQFGNLFGSPEYAYEELIAEITSCFLSAELDLEQGDYHIENHKAYVQNWISAIREKPETLAKAIAEAEKAACYMEQKAGLVTLKEYDLTARVAREAAEQQLEPERTPVGGKSGQEVIHYRETNETAVSPFGGDFHLAEVTAYIKKIQEKIQTADPNRQDGLAAFSIARKRLDRLSQNIPGEQMQLKRKVEFVACSTSIEDLKGRLLEILEPVSMRYHASRRLLVDMDGTLAKFHPVEQLETLYEPGYFRNLEPQQTVVEAIREILWKHPEREVYIMSSVLRDSKYALQEKNEWLDRYLPEIDQEHRIFPPCGENKARYVPEGSGVRIVCWTTIHIT